MLRLLRIMGVVVFAVLIGFAANSLKQMHESGELFEKYNSGRRANITLLSFSVIALGVLTFLEVTTAQRRFRRRHYGERRHHEYIGDETEGLDSTSIYASNRKADDWEKKRHTKRGRGYFKPNKTREGFGVLSLRFMSVVLPLLYMVVLTWSLVSPPQDAFLSIVIPAVFSVLLLLSLVVVVGLSRKKTWGLTFGYILALINLVIFPVGTAIGMFLILALVGASQSFADSALQAKKKSRQRNTPRSSMAVI